MGYTLSRAAEDDLAAIAEYTVQAFGVEQAITYRDGLLEALEFLAQFPKAARVRTELRQETRAFAYRSHLIFYRLSGENIFVQRIRHSKEDWSNQPEAL